MSFWFVGQNRLGCRHFPIRQIVKGLQVLAIAAGPAGCVTSAPPSPFTTGSIATFDGLRGSIDPQAMPRVTLDPTANEPVAHETRAAFFNAVALPLSSPVQGRSWDRVRSPEATAQFNACLERHVCPNRTTRSAAALIEQAAGEGVASQIGLVNSGINGLVNYAADEQLYGKPDHWADLDQTLAIGAGDCEDLAIAKMLLLQKLGFDTRDLTLVLLRDERRQVFHAVLIVRTGERNVVLDSVTNVIREDREVAGYLPLVSFSNDRSWIYGSRISEQTGRSAHNGSNSI